MQKFQHLFLSGVVRGPKLLCDMNLICLVPNCQQIRCSYKIFNDRRIRKLHWWRMHL